MVNNVPMSNFIYDEIARDIKRGKISRHVHTRFPPEPNGYLHIGHAKAIGLNFDIADAYEGGLCNLRLDDSNPENESAEYVEAIKTDVRWLGFDWGDRLYFASDYYETLYDYAVMLIKAGKAYVESLSADEIRAYRGTLTRPGTESPDRKRTVADNLNLFAQMRAGEFAEGQYVLRAKIDMASANMNLRDPTIYRIKKIAHYRTQDAWCIYPMYDFAHCMSDAIEGITHSLCTLEFEDHRPLYDWFLAQLPVKSHPRQIEFARLNLSGTVTSKRKLNTLVARHHVSGWDDPRIPTIAGMRRRGYPPEAIRDFCKRIGVTKNDTVIDLSVLENCVREALNKTTRRSMAVLKPLRVVIENYPDGQGEELDAPYHPKDVAMGRRKIPFSKTLYIERDDFMETPPAKFFRLAPGAEVRLKYAYFITCTEIVKSADGELVELRCRYDPSTRGGNAPDGRKVKGTLHWVSAAYAVTAEVRLYDRLLRESPPVGRRQEYDWQDALNPRSLEIIPNALVEPELAGASPGERFQFERLGYFCVDSKDLGAVKPVFNRTITLRDSWVKQRGQR